MKWKCEGVNESIKKIEIFLNTSKSRDKAYRAYRALQSLDKTITVLMNDDMNDEKYLLTCRRKVRTLLRKVAI